LSGCLFLILHLFQKNYFLCGYSALPEPARLTGCKRGGCAWFFNGTCPLQKRCLIGLMQKRKPPSANAPTKPAPAPGQALVPLQPVSERIGETADNLRARENAFAKRRRGPPR
jgi:hypothetical protein